MATGKRAFMFQRPNITINYELKIKQKLRELVLILFNTIYNKKAHGLKAQPLKGVILSSSPSVNRKLLTHILTNVSTHPSTHNQTSELGDYNKLNLWLSL